SLRIAAAETQVGVSRQRGDFFRAVAKLRSRSSRRTLRSATAGISRTAATVLLAGRNPAVGFANYLAHVVAVTKRIGFHFIFADMAASKKMQRFRLFGNSKASGTRNGSVTADGAQSSSSARPNFS